MAEETTAPPETPEAKETKESPAPKETPEVTPEEQKIIDAADSPEAVRNLIDREREARKAAEKTASEAAAKVKEHEDAQKSDEQKLAEERDELKAKAAATEAEALRLRVALKKKVPAELIDRLQGSDEEELEADADALLKLVSPEESKEKQTDFDGGARNQAQPEVQPGLGRLARAYSSSGSK